MRDANFTSEHCASTLGDYLALVQAERVYACAELHRVATKVIGGNINWNTMPITGTVTFFQDSPFDSTRASMRLNIDKNVVR